MSAATIPAMGDAPRRPVELATADSDDEREVLAVERMVSLTSQEPDWEEAWAGELDRRVAEVRSGGVPLRAWTDVRDELRAHLAATRRR